MLRCGLFLKRIKTYSGFACGPKPMLKTWLPWRRNTAYPVRCPWKSGCLRRGGLPGCAIQMADGTMKHVCKDGPVFDAEEVEWNV